MLCIIEIDTDRRIVAAISFDIDDIDAAFEELDARYLAGEAAAYAHTWSVISGIYSGFNRHQLPATTPDWVNVDHRLLIAIEPNDMSAFNRAVWDLTPKLKIHVETVHRLDDLGAVVTHIAHGSTPEGVDAEWRMIYLYTVDGDLISRGEIFDDTDLDPALARLEELHARPRGGARRDVVADHRTELGG